MAPADVAALRGLFARATAHRLAPRVYLVAGDLEIRLAPAGVLARHPASIYVTAPAPARFPCKGCNKKRTADEGEKINVQPSPASNDIEKRDMRSWLGRVGPSGVFVPARTTTGAQAQAIVAAIAGLAAEPERVAAAYGHATGRCCFCDLVLTDPRSIAVGYGPICACKFGIPWGIEKKGRRR